MLIYLIYHKTLRLSTLYWLVLPFETVDNWSSLCKPISDRFFHQGAVQTGHLILEKCSIRGLLLVPSSTCPVLATEDIRSGKQMDAGLTVFSQRYFDQRR